MLFLLTVFWWTGGQYCRDQQCPLYSFFVTLVPCKSIRWPNVAGPVQFSASAWQVLAQRSSRVKMGKDFATMGLPHMGGPPDRGTMVLGEVVGEVVVPPWW